MFVSLYGCVYVVHLEVVCLWECVCVCVLYIEKMCSFVWVYVL